MSLWEIVENVFNEYFIGPSPAMRNVLLRWRKLCTPLGPEVSLSSAWPVASASPELENKSHCARSGLINNESPESLLRADCCCWCDCVYHLCPGYHVFVHSHHFALYHLPLICFWISQSSNNFGFLACTLWNNWGFPQVCQSLTSHPIFSLPIKREFILFCFGWFMIYLWIQLSDCVSPDTLGHAFHNLHFTSADVDLLNLSQKWKPKFSSL